jgi:drug/metabolite transporter (DMT)-like permease
MGSRLQVLVAAALFSTGGAAVKAIGLTGWQVACFRSAVATVALALLLPAARRWPTGRALAIALAYATTMVLFVLANKLTTAAGAIFLQSTFPLWVLLLSPWLLGERVSGRDVAFMGVFAAGMALFFVGLEPATQTAPHPLLGNVLGLVSGIFWALTVIGLRAAGVKKEGNWGPVSVLWGNGFAAALCLPFALPVSGATGQDLGIILYLGIFQIGVAYVLLLAGLAHVRALEASLLLLLEPILNPVWAWLIHGEVPGAWAIVGGAVILAATLLKSRLDAREAPA